MDLKHIVIPALDGLDFEKAKELVFELKNNVFAFKIHDLWDKKGPGVVKILKEFGAPRVWVDLKLKDIPQTVKNRAKAVKDAGGDIVTVMADGEIEMMMAAVETGLEVYAVTVLTSLDEEQSHLTYGQPSKAAVLYLARLAQLAQVHGIVSSPKEVGMLKKRPELKTCFITPGVRSSGKDAQDQKRIDTHKAAIEAGATHLVVGREITTATDPMAALENIWSQIQP